MPRLMLLPLLLRCIAAFQPSTHTRQSLPLLPSLPNHPPLVSKASSHCLVSHSHPAPLQNRCRQPLMRTGDAPDAADRAIACAVYLLPFLDGFRYGLYIYKTVPIIGQLAFQFLPLVNTFQSVSRRLCPLYCIRLRRIWRAMVYHGLTSV